MGNAVYIASLTFLGISLCFCFGNLKQVGL